MEIIQTLNSLEMAFKNRYIMTDPYEIKTILDDTAKELVQILPYTSNLRGWVVYFLEVLEAETKSKGEFNKMLVDLLEDIELRIDSGSW